MKRSDMMMIATAVALAAGAGPATAHERGAGAFGALGAMGERPGIAEFDADGDGGITAEDFGLRRAERFAALDADGDGQVSRAEFEAHAGARAAERAGTLFDHLDVDGDGMLSRDAIEARGGEGMPARMPARMLDRLDADGDGIVSEAEFDAAADRMAEHMERRGDGMRGMSGMWGRDGHRHD